jgi:hypothetical protein
MNGTGRRPADVLSILDIDALLGDPRLVVKETRT